MMCPKPLTASFSLFRSGGVVNDWVLVQASRILGEAVPSELRSRPGFVSTQAAVLEGMGKEATALEVASRLQQTQPGDKSKSKAEKAAISRGLLPLLARLQLKVPILPAN
jgi:hypothetical protein